MDESKANILNAASALFLKGGVAALSVRAIANKAGVSTIGIYSHFKNKQGILDTLYVEGFGKVKQAMQITDTDLQPQAAVLEACKNYLDNAVAFGAHYRLIFSERDDGYTPSTEALKVGAEAFAVLTALVARLLPASASQSTQHDAAIQLWSVVHGFVSLAHHDVSLIVDMSQWQERSLRTLKVIIAAIANDELP